MPSYPLTDLRHPVNRARSVYVNALALDPPGTILPTALWTRYLAIGLGVSRQQGHDYTQRMEDYGMIRLHARIGVELLAPEGVILPPIIPGLV